MGTSLFNMLIGKLHDFEGKLLKWELFCMFRRILLHLQINKKAALQLARTVVQRFLYIVQFSLNHQNPHPVSDK